MTTVNPIPANKKNNVLVEFFGWLRIVASPLLAGMAIGFIVYIEKPGEAGLMITILIAFIGLIAEIIWATKISK